METNVSMEHVLTASLMKWLSSSETRSCQGAQPAPKIQIDPS